MKTRIIQTRFWDDDLIFELPSNGKLLFLYLISNQNIGMTGAYEIHKKRICLDTGLNISQVDKMLELIKTKIVYLDNWVIVLNASKYNNYASNKMQQKAYIREYLKLPSLIKSYVDDFGLSDGEIDTENKKYKKGYKTNYIHRDVAQNVLGRELTENEVVHHIDKDIHNNLPDNLVVMDSETHKLLHQGKIDISDSSIIVLSRYCNSTHKSEIINNKPEIRKNKNREIDIYINKFNELFESKYTVTKERHVKFKLRRKKFSVDDILNALINLASSDFHRGDNDRGWKAFPLFLIRSDEQIEKWLNVKKNGETSKKLGPGEMYTPDGRVVRKVKK